jgi:hypothetical protein
MKKRIFGGILVLAALMAALAVFAGCGTQGVRGSGEMVNFSIDAANFIGIDIYGGFEVIFRRSPDFSVNLSIQENLFEHIEVDVRGGNLRVRTIENIRTDAGFTPRLYIDAPSIERAVFAGAVNARDWDDIRTESFSLNASGAVNVEFFIVAESINIDVAGAANLVLSGDAHSLELVVAGAANVEAFGLVLYEAVIDLAGAGSVDINASNYLDVNLSGVGTVNFMGNPRIARNVTGLGRINSVN